MTRSTDEASVDFSSASWNRSRSLAELRAFVSARDEALEVEEFDL